MPVLRGARCIGYCLVVPLRLTVEVSLVPTAEGGRATALTSGWRGVVWFGERWTESDVQLWPPGQGRVPVGEELVYGCELRLDSGSPLAPGMGGRGEIELWALGDPRPAIHPGAEFELREGARKIGTGRTFAVSSTPRL
jgi:hypothetical protein